MEQRTLDHTIIMQGIAEIQDETEANMKDSVIAELAATVVGDTHDEN